MQPINAIVSFSKAIELGKSLLQEGKILRVTAGGNSMRPFIKKGDVLFIKEYDNINYRVGDIIVFKSGDKFIAHRLLIVRIINGEKIYISKGDALLNKEKVLAKDIVGKVIAVLKKEKYIDYLSKKRISFNKAIAKSYFLILPLNLLLKITNVLMRKAIKLKQ